MKKLSGRENEKLRKRQGSGGEEKVSYHTSGHTSEPKKGRQILESRKTWG